MKILDAFPNTDMKQLARMLTRPKWLFYFCWRLISYLAWLVWNRRLPTPYNIPFKLVFIWPEPPPTREQVDRFNADREEERRKLRLKLDELKVLVEKAKMEERAKLNEL